MEFLSHEKLFKLLRQWYNMDKNYCNITKITLPSSKAVANIVWNDAKSVLESLLTDPRITDDDYNFFNNDPLCPPPEDLDYIGDLNTGKCYYETYRRYVKDPTNEILLPVLMYIDGAATGQFAHLPITAVKISLGILGRRAHDKPYFWRSLGYIPAFAEHKSRGKWMLMESGHVDAIMAHQNALNDEGHLASTEAHPSQDLHSMLEVILDSFLPIQNNGFHWDFCYRGKVYKKVKFIPFVPFIKCNTDEGDRLAGSYTSRTRYVKQLCRYCECPTQECDDPLADYRLKTVAKIQGLIDADDFDGLANLSQQYIKNATYALRFGCHSGQGVHGACPLEMLHAILLGIFKYVWDCMFEQIGKDSKLADKINALLQEYGELLSHQSERNMPKTKFKNGIRKGKLMAKEYTGVLVCMAAVLRSTKGQDLLQKKTP